MMREVRAVAEQRPLLAWSVALGLLGVAGWYSIGWPWGSGVAAGFWTCQACEFFDLVLKEHRRELRP